MKHYKTLKTSIFFVLGFTLVFAILGVLLQTTFSHVSYDVMQWLTKLGGIIIIFFGLYTLGLIKIDLLLQQFSLKDKIKVQDGNWGAFVFGAAFAMGWTPCVGPIVGAILTLAATQPSQAFVLLLAYALGTGLPFLILGFSIDRSKKWLKKTQKYLGSLQKIFGGILVILGALMFTSQLARISNFFLVETFMLPQIGSGVNIGIAFFAGVVSFLSPCVVPLLPGFLTYLATLSKR